MSAGSLSDRVAALEQEVRELKRLLDSNGEKRGWRRLIGAFANDPYFEEAMRLGREYRESLRPKRSKKPKK
jgi:hypothetical protein